MVVKKLKTYVYLAIQLLFGSASLRIRLLVSIMRESRLRGNMKTAAFCARLLERYGVYLSSNATIGRGLKLPHPTSIVIGEGVSIGSNVTLYQSVTLGGRIIGDWKKGNYPEVADGSVLFAGVVAVGKVRIGKNCIIGANSVVLADIPDNSVAVGAPARVVKTIEATKEMDRVNDAETSN